MTFFNDSRDSLNKEVTSVYFIAATSAVKIGIAVDLNPRIHNLQTSHPDDLELICVIECEDRQRAVQVEQFFHELYAPLHIRREWYDVSPKKVARHVELVMGINSWAKSYYQYTNENILNQIESRYRRSKPLDFKTSALIGNAIANEHTIVALRKLADDLEQNVKNEVVMNSLNQVIDSFD